MSLASDVRHVSRTNPSTRQKIKYSKRKDTPGSFPAGDHRWSATQADFWHPTGVRCRGADARLPVSAETGQ